MEINMLELKFNFHKQKAAIQIEFTQPLIRRARLYGTSEESETDNEFIKKQRPETFVNSKIPFKKLTCSIKDFATKNLGKFILID